MTEIIIESKDFVIVHNNVNIKMDNLIDAICKEKI
jgi:hypothetical protein